MTATKERPDINDTMRTEGDAAARSRHDKAQKFNEGDTDGVSLNDFHAYMPMHNYIFAPSREMWPASSVNARLPAVTVQTAEGPRQVAAAKWLDQHKPIEQMTWAPGLPMLVRNRLVSNGGWIERSGVTCFNLYRPPTIQAGDAFAVTPWIDHIRKAYSGDADHIIKWLAHRVQRPDQKINHALVFGGSPGIGKDTLLEPVKQAIGPWNFAEVSPEQLLGRFNGFVKSVILRVSEARDLGDFNRFQFYDRTKVYIAAPPDVLRVDEKNLREYSVFNVTGVIITTNHKLDGIYLPPDDRRHYVAWSDLAKNDFPAGYWNTLWRWYEAGGIKNVAAYLAALDLSDFDPNAAPLKTEAFWSIVNANHAPEDAELADVLDEIGNPEALTLARIQGAATGTFQTWISDRKNSRLIPHRLEKGGYTAVRNDGPVDGLWKLNGKRQVIYARTALSIPDRIAAARRLLE